MMPAIEIVRRRWMLVAIVRLASVCIGCLALIPIISWLSEGISDDDLLDMHYYLPRIIRGAVLVAIGAIGFLLAEPLVRLATPVRSDIRCPKCRYELLSPSESQCPECGLDVSSLWGRMPLVALSEVAWRARMTSIITAVLRVVGVVMCLFSSLDLPWAIAWLTQNFFLEALARLLVTMARPLVFGLGGVALIVFARRLAIRIVPRPATACPSCGYLLGELPPENCQECGWALGGPKAVASPSQRRGGGDHACGEPSDEHPDRP